MALHQERSGSTVFARYAFNELVSFIAGWAVLLDYIILIAVTCYSATHYLRVFWHPLGNRGSSLGLAIVFIAIVVLANIRGIGWRRSGRITTIVAADLGLQLLIVVLGLVLFFNPHTLLDPDPPRQRAEMVGPGLRADGRGDLVHEPRVGSRPRRRGEDLAAAR